MAAGQQPASIARCADQSSFLLYKTGVLTASCRGVPQALKVVRTTGCHAVFPVSTPKVVSTTGTWHCSGLRKWFGLPEGVNFVAAVGLFAGSR